MSAAIKAQTRAALALSKGYAERTGLDLRIALIDGRFAKTSEKPFDQAYMKALFAHGEALARDLHPHMHRRQELWTIPRFEEDVHDISSLARVGACLRAEG